MLFRSGLLLSFFAVCLQIAVFLQPLLPKQYQIAPVCETITRALLLNKTNSTSHISHSISEHAHHQAHHVETTIDSQHSSAHDHDMNHQCQYCTVYGNLVLPPELEVKEVLVRIQVRLIAYQKAFLHVWYVLQQLFLIPQGRAPPLYS